eukprot:6693368-Pyramimonas_sp.AAC.1
MPKGSDAFDGNAEGCLRKAANIRALGLRNTDVKIMASVINFSLKKIAARVVPWTQRGFVAH